MTKFTYNNVKNTSTGHTFFKLNYSCHSRISYNENVDLRSKSKSAKKLSIELGELMTIY